MTSPAHRSLPFAPVAAPALALALVLAGCGDRSDDASLTAKSDAPSTRVASTRADAADSTPSAPDSADGSGAAAQERGSDAASAVMGAAPDVRVKADGPAAAPIAAEPKTDDARLTSMVLVGLKADKELNPLHIDVDTREGVVTLSGSVPSAAAKARASEIAANVRNVRSVNNQLTLTAG